MIQTTIPDKQFNQKESCSDKTNTILTNNIYDGLSKVNIEKTDS